MAPVFTPFRLFVKTPNLGSESSWLLWLIQKLIKTCVWHVDGLSSRSLWFGWHIENPCMTNGLGFRFILLSVCLFVSGDRPWLFAKGKLAIKLSFKISLLVNLALLLLMLGANKPEHPLIICSVPPQLPVAFLYCPDHTDVWVSRLSIAAFCAWQSSTNGLFDWGRHANPALALALVNIH